MSAATVHAAAADAGPRVSELRVEGLRQGHTVVLIHGWPDSQALWDPTVAVLAPHYRCVRFTLPGFGSAADGRAYSLDEVVQAIATAIDEACPQQPVTLLLHDWGCFFGYQYATRHRDRVARVIGVDIGDAGSRYHRQQMGLRAIAQTLGYQWWLALAWRIGGGLGDRMARWMARRFRAPAPAATVTAAGGYPYAVQWLGVAGGYGRLRAYAPMVPMCFIHGARKAFGFHSDAWAERIRARPGGRVVALPTGHWVMTEAPEAFHAAVLGWLRDTDRMRP